VHEYLWMQSHRKYSTIIKTTGYNFDILNLRILHLSDMNLPDWRIEKSAISASNLGHEVIFGGMKPINYNRKVFSKIFEINWTPKARMGFPLYWRAIKKQVNKVLEETKPDIIHAHNIFSAKMISEFDIPFVYDDHEYWSIYVKRQLEALKLNATQSISASLPRRLVKSYARNLLKRHSMQLWTKWEEEIVSSTPTITVSDKISEELKIIGNNTKKVFVVPNFPMRNEVKDIEKPRLHTRLSSVYAGKEAKGENKTLHRNIDGLTDVFYMNDIGDIIMIGIEGKSTAKVKYTGFLTRQAMYSEMFKHSIGLIPFKKHWSHVFISPNKAYEYAHAGLFVLCTSSFTTVSSSLKENCATFEDYNHMISQLEYFRDNLEELYNRRLKIFEFARNHLIWEKYEKNILNAYQLCR
jgi:hypothetical protein